jgi:hypothetical protein
VKWSQVADLQFYNKDCIYINLIKQVTSEDSTLLYNYIPEDYKVEVFLWKKYCLNIYTKSRVVLNTDGSRIKGTPKCTVYPWVIIRDIVGQTLFTTLYR